MKYEIVPFHNIFEIVYNNKDEHIKEMGEHGNNICFDWEYIIKCSLDGECIAVTMVDDDKKGIAGYAVFLIDTDITNYKRKCAVNVILYVGNNYRGRKSIDFIKNIDKLLKDIGVVSIDFTLSDDKLGKLLGRNGYKITSKTWSKEIE